MNQPPALESELRELILRALDERHTVTLGDERTPGLQDKRAQFLDQIDFSGKRVLDLGSNLGELSREARIRGAVLVDGFDYDSYFIEVAELVNAFNGTTRVSFYQRDIGDPGVYTERYDMVLAFAVMGQGAANALSRIAEITDVLVCETHRLEGNFEVGYMQPVSRYFPFHRMLGESDGGGSLDRQEVRATIVFAKTQEALAGALRDPVPVIEEAEAKPIFGEIESFDFDGSHLRVAGWVIHAEERLDLVEARIGRASIVGGTKTTLRHDIAERYAHTEFARRNGFELDKELGPEALMRVTGTDLLQFRLTALQDWMPIGEMSAFYLPGMFDVPWPDAALAEPTMGTSDPRRLSSDSIRHLHAMLEPLRAYRAPESFERVLDWGCRAGYLEAFIAHFMPDAQVTGIDTNTEAIEWARQAGRTGEFIAVAPAPPTELPADWFDLVLGYSMLGQMTMEDQWPWLEELHRVMKSGAYALLTTNGDLLAPFIKDDDIREPVERGGYSSDMLARYSAGSADAIPRRATYQAKTFSIREYSSLFDVMRYRTGALNDEDLIILRKS